MSLFYNVAGPPEGLKGQPTPIYVTPVSPLAADTVTFSDGGNGGTFNPASLTFGTAPGFQIVTYTNNTPGTYQITITSGAGGIVNGSPFTVVIPNLTAETNLSPYPYN